MYVKMYFKLGLGFIFVFVFVKLRDKLNLEKKVTKCVLCKLAVYFDVCFSINNKET